MIRRVTLSIIMICAVSCTMVEIAPPVLNGSNTGHVEVDFYAEGAVYSRSCISPDENQIDNLNVYAFRDGVLVDEVYVSGEGTARLCLAAGYSYNIYALANMGKIDADVEEHDFINTVSYSINDIDDLSSNFPMFCSYEGIYIGGGTPTVRLDMQRLVCKLSLSIDKGALMEGLQVNSVRLCQCSSVARPFKWYGKGGSRAETADDIINGDYATSEDLQKINGGDAVVFYTLENCQGILLPDNKDPSLKIPQMVGEKEDLCTYLEVSCVFGPEGMLGGEVDYRIYLGLDSISSFDLPGNACINVMLKLTDDALHEVSWKVDSDVSVRNGYAHGCISQGMHAVNDLYVGEKILYEVVLTDELQEYLGGDAEGCSLAFYQNGSLSDKIMTKKLQTDDGVFQYELCCKGMVSGKEYGELRLFSPQGECIGCLEDGIVVKAPKIVFAEHSSWIGSAPVKGLTDIPEMEINGEPARFYIYRVDENGYNLNGAGSYGFDNSLFEYDVIGAGYNNSVVNGISEKCVNLSTGVPGEAATEICVYCDNDGRDYRKNKTLSEAYSLSGAVTVEICDESLNISDEIGIKCSIPQVSMTLVDNGWAKYHDCQLSVIVDNPSNLPLEVRVCELFATNGQYGPVDADEVEKNLILERIQYMTGEFYNGAPPIYGSMAFFNSEINTEVYPLVGISTNDIIKAVNYDKRGIGHMVHLIDVTVDNYKIRADDVFFMDKVSDGSAAYDYLYYDVDSWNYRGAMLSSSGILLADDRSWAYEYPNLSAYSLFSMYDIFNWSGPVSLSMDFDYDSERVSLSSQSGSGPQNGLVLSIDYSGVVNGYVKTYPKGTWFPSENNYCSVNVSDLVTGVALLSSGSDVWADNGQIMAALDEIYEFSYQDSSRPLGANAYLHRAHPTDLALNVNYRIEGDKGKNLYPINIDWMFDGINYYHEQDEKNYKCTLSADSQSFNLVLITLANL